jgi:hypothetical protein
MHCREQRIASRLLTAFGGGRMPGFDANRGSAILYQPGMSAILLF